jgi:hypothetical protein
VFYTITCPSRFHATLNNGRPNPKWTSATVRQSSDYLVDTFAAFRKAMHKAGLRWYGVRVAEPHHDGTVHWHLLCFMRKKDRRSITALLRKFAIREDREELGNNTGRASSLSLSTRARARRPATSPNTSARTSTGAGWLKKSAKKPADHCGTAPSTSAPGRHCTVSSSSVSVFRGVRLTASCACWQVRRRVQGDKKAGAPVLDNPRLDAVLAAADAGLCHLHHEAGRRAGSP